MADYEDKLHGALVQRFSLWVTVGNAAGLAALASKVGDDLTAPLALLLFPSMWSFAFGIAEGAIFSMMLMVMYSREGQKSKTLGQGILLLSAFVGAIACFMFGLFYPLVVLTIRYFTHHSLA